MKKIVTSVALATLLMLPVNVQAKQTKVDQMMIAIKKGQVKKAWKINKSLPEYYGEENKLSAKVKKAYNQKIIQTNSTDANKKYWTYALMDITGDRIPELFLEYGKYAATSRFVIYSYTSNHTVKKLGDFFVGKNLIVMSPGTHHFYSCNAQDSYVDHIYKITYKNGKFVKKKYADYHWRKNGDMGWLFNGALNSKSLNRTI